MVTSSGANGGQQSFIQLQEINPDMLEGFKVITAVLPGNTRSPDEASWNQLIEALEKVRVRVNPSATLPTPWTHRDVVMQRPTGESTNRSIQRICAEIASNSSMIFTKDPMMMIPQKPSILQCQYLYLYMCYKCLSVVTIQRRKQHPLTSGGEQRWPFKKQRINSR